MIHIDEIVALVIPEDDPEAADAYSMISGPLTDHVSYARSLQRIILERLQGFFDSALCFLRETIQISCCVAMYDDFAHQMESRSI